MKGKRYFAQVRGEKEQLPVEVEELAPNRYAVSFQGKRFEVDSAALPNSSLSMVVDGQSHYAELDDAGDDVAVSIRGKLSHVDLVDERRLRQRAASAAFSAEGKQVITAPMPGKIVKVMVKVGDEVTEGQGLVVVEAMKMENELKAPKAGKVTALVAVEGATVENNAPLVTIE